MRLSEALSNRSVALSLGENLTGSQFALWLRIPGYFTASNDHWENGLRWKA
jgi:hypothetical protein